LGNLFQKYRKFRAHNKYSYPGLFMVLGGSKALLQIGVVFVGAWFAVSLMTSELKEKENELAQNSNVADESSKLTGLADDSQAQAEVTATAATQATNPIRKSHTKIPAAKAGVYNADWLLKQDGGSYVVQLASSIEKPDLYQKAFDLSETHPAVVFPFKKTRSNQLMYGYAIGMYDTVREARAGIKQLSGNAVAEGVWIRPVGEIQKQIVNTRK